MINRLGLLIHWIGFLCLVGFIGLIISEGSFPDFLDIAEFMFDFDNLSDSTGTFFLVWFATAHWPIKWFITGNKSFFPWKS